MQSLLQHISKTRQSQTFKNSYWSLLDVALYPLLMTLLTPMYIRYLGVEQYGIWMLAGNLAQLMNALNMGVGESTIRQVSKNRDEALRHNISAAVSSNLVVSTVLMIISIILGLLIASNLENFNFFRLSSKEAGEAGYMVMLLTASVGLRFIELVLLSVFKGFERFDIAAKLSALSRNGTIITSIILLLCGYGFVGILWLTLILNILNILIQLACLKKFFPFIRLTLTGKSTSLLQIIESNGWYWLQFVIAMGGFMADRFLVAHYTGMKIFGYYSVAAMIGSQLHSILATFGTFVFPRVSFMSEKGSTVLPVYYKASSAILGAGWFVICMLLLTGPFIFNLWLGSETYEASKFFIDPYLIYEAVMVISIVPYQFINGTSYVRFNSLFELTMRGIQVLLMLIFYRVFGTHGIVYALIAGAVLIIPLQLSLFGTYVLRISKHRFLSFMLPLIPLLFILFIQSLLLRFGCALLCAALYYKMVWPFFTNRFDEASIAIKQKEQV